MHLISLVWFLFCPFLFIFLLRLRIALVMISVLKKGSRKIDVKNVVEFMEKVNRTISLDFGRRALLCILSLVRIESRSFKFFLDDVRTYGHRDTDQICNHPRGEVRLPGIPFFHEGFRNLGSVKPRVRISGELPRSSLGCLLILCKVSLQFLFRYAWDLGRYCSLRREHKQVFGESVS